MSDHDRDPDVDDDQEEEEGDKIQVKFVTKLDDPKYQAPETAFYIPVALSRYGLSEVLNHLLNLKTPQPFDFLVQSPSTSDSGKFLRTTLEKFTKKHQISYEDTVIELEYVIALESPKPKSECEHEDWIACVAVPTLQKTPYCFSAGYDGIVKIWVPSTATENDCSLAFSAHAQPIKSISLFNSDEKSTQLLTGAQDNAIKWWQLKRIHKKPENKLAARQANIIGVFPTESSVESLSVSPSGDKFVSGTFDGSMYVWDLEVVPTLVREVENDGEPALKKKKKEPIRKESLKVKEHVGCVSSVNWYDDEKCISGSWDHSIRLWDFPSGVCVHKMYGGTSIYSISYQKDSQLVLSGHSDRSIRLWDCRTAGQAVKEQYKSHTAWIPSVQWHPTNQFLFASASHDGSVKVWDSRSHFPLHSLSAHDPKALCVSWYDSQTIISGGSDSKLKFHQFDNPIKTTHQ